MSKAKAPRIGRIIREARMSKGYSQAQLGRMCGLKYGNFITMIESGKSDIHYNLKPIPEKLSPISVFGDKRAHCICIIAISHTNLQTPANLNCRLL